MLASDNTNFIKDLESARDVVQERKKLQQIQKAAYPEQKAHEEHIKQMYKMKKKLQRLAGIPTDSTITIDPSIKQKRKKKVAQNPVLAGFPKNIWQFTKQDVSKARKKKIKLSVFIAESVKEAEAIKELTEERYTTGTYTGLSTFLDNAIKDAYSTGNGNITITTGSSTQPMYTNTTSGDFLVEELEPVKKKYKKAKK